jgi:hypothetical protein
MKGAMKVRKYVTRKITLINTMVPVSSRRKIQARHKDYKKSNSKVY